MIGIISVILDECTNDVTSNCTISTGTNGTYTIAYGIKITISDGTNDILYMQANYKGNITIEQSANYIKLASTDNFNIWN